MRAPDYDEELHCRLPIQACSAMHMHSIQAMTYILQVDPNHITTIDTAGTPTKIP
jgi:hypothetical protein